MKNPVSSVVSALLAAAVAPVTPPAPPGPPAAPTWDTLPAFLEAAADDGFTGAVLAVHDGEVVVDRGYGLANRERGIPITPDTIFAVGSEPIDFTHAGILWLAQHDKLTLDDPLTAFFDDVPPDKRAITVEQLMTGASGLPNFHDLPGDRDPDHAWIDRDQAMRRIFAMPLLFRPGSDRRHSHSAWGVLAAILEIASGRSYRDFTREHLFAPAGMHDTGFNGDWVPLDRLAIGYGLRSDGDVNAPPWWGPTSWLVMGSGGQISTTRDIARFLDAMREGRILAPEWAQRYFGPGPGADRNGDDYGFEMFVYRAPGARSYVITMTNANRPGPDDDDDTIFVRTSRALGDVVLGRTRPPFSLGIEMAPRGQGGVEVVRVVPGGAAEQAGLLAGDVLLAADGTPLGDDPLAVLDPSLRDGSPIAFAVRRGERTLEITVRPAPTR